MSVGDGDRVSDLAVMEAQEYKQKQLLRRLLEAQEKVEQQADEAEERYVFGEIDRHARNTVVLHAVRELIRVAWPLLLDHYRECDERPNKKERQQIEDGEADRENYLCVYMEERALGEVEIGQEETREFRGLYDILTCDEIYVQSRSVKRTFPHGPNTTETTTRRVSVPIDVSWEAYLTVNEFLADEHGLKLQFEELEDSLKPFGFETVDVSDLDVQQLEEIEELVDGGVDARAVTNGDGGADDE